MTKQKLDLLYRLDTLKDRTIGSLHETERRLSLVFSRIEGRVELAFDRVAEFTEGRL